MASDKMLNWTVKDGSRRFWFITAVRGESRPSDETEWHIFIKDEGDEPPYRMAFSVFTQRQAVTLPEIWRALQEDMMLLTMAVLEHRNEP